MMKTRLNGTERPKKDAGGLRHGLLVLAVLLLTCVLMAGAVSAEEPVAKLNNGTEYATIQDAIDSSDSLNYTITLLSDVTLTIDSQNAPIEISGKKIVLDLNGKTISGTDTLSTQTTAGNAMLIEVRGATSALTLYDNSSEKTGTITLKAETNREWNAMSVIIRNSYSKLTINGGNLTHLGGTDMAYAVDTTAVTNVNADLIVNGGKLSSTYTGIRNFANSADAYSNITVTGGEISGAARGIWIQQTSSSAGLNTLTVQGGTISGTGDKGMALYLDQNAACQSIVSISGGVFKNKKDSQNGVIRVTVENDATASTSSVSISGATLTTLTGEEPLVPVLVTVEGDVIAPVTTWNDETLLFPGVEYADSVEWTGDDDSGYTLTIDEAGSYKLMDGFVTTGSGIQITAGGVTLDGNGKTITAEGNTLTVVADITGPVTIKNVVATISTSTTNPNLDSPINIMSPVVMENNLFDITNFNNEAGDTVAVILTAGAEGSTLKGTQIIMGSADNTGVQGIAVYGNKVTISGSTITTTALQNDDKSTGIYTVGVGDITITDNTFVSEAENGAGNRGIMVYNPTADAGQSITITDNTFDLAAGAGDTAGAVVAVSSDDDSKNTVNLDVTKNTVTAAARGVYLVSDVTVTGDVAGNDFRAIPEESQIATAEGVEPNVENLHTGNNDAPVDPQPTPLPPSGGSSGSGNMNNAYRVLFNDGATTLSVQTDLSSGDKLTKPETPVKDGYTFAGWYKDSACTQGWDFETGISGDMTLYAKWTAAGSSGETEATATPTSTAVTTPQPTKTQTAAATTSVPQATTAAGVSPTLTQAPAPVAGALFGLLAAGVLLRRRFQ